MNRENLELGLNYDCYYGFLDVKPLKELANNSLTHV